MFRLYKYIIWIRKIFYKLWFENRFCLYTQYWEVIDWFYTFRNIIWSKIYDEISVSLPKIEKLSLCLSTNCSVVGFQKVSVAPGLTILCTHYVMYVYLLNWNDRADYAITQDDSTRRQRLKLYTVQNVDGSTRNKTNFCRSYYKLTYNFIVIIDL